jgi:hypothetical protein
MAPELGHVNTPPIVTFDPRVIVTPYTPLTAPGIVIPFVVTTAFAVIFSVEEVPDNVMTPDSVIAPATLKVYVAILSVPA